MMYIVALTGGIGTGKTTVSNEFKKLGVDVIDTDVIAKYLIKPGSNLFKKIVKKFGKSILENNILNRKILRKKIFSSKQNRMWLENLLHPLIYYESFKLMSHLKSKWCIWVVPLLIEKKMFNKVNRIILLDCSIKNQIYRVIKRDSITKQEVKKIIKIQASKKKKYIFAHDIIYNNSDLNDVKKKVYILKNFYTYVSKNIVHKKNI
ncbi:dephospho-CoA kinase [Buchnera aphidicola (Taiwanaphis decaspermi)]|uniref:dephospho-CoA kinase n=1 Tax=Buchnera aphidicola TaxID=9 RepID=UPI0031B80FE9